MVDEHLNFDAAIAFLRQVYTLEGTDAAVCGIRGIADRIPTQAGQHSDDCGQPMRAG